MIRCPKCGSTFPLSEAQAEGEWSEIIRLMPSFGPHGRLVFEYVELFGVIPLRTRGKKILRLLQELANLFDNEKFSYHKKEYSISRAGIVEALKTVVNRSFQEPLKNHNYLKVVMTTTSEIEQKERREVAEREQRGREDRGSRIEEEGKLPAERVRELAGEFLKGM